MSKKLEELASDMKSKIEALEKRFEELRQESTEDLVIHKGDLEQDFNRSWLILKWLDKSMYWKTKVEAARDVLSGVIAETNSRLLSDSMYSMTDKQLKAQIDGDKQVQAYQRQYQTIDKIYQYCIRLQEILKGQMWEIRDLIAYQRFKAGLDR